MKRKFLKIYTILFLALSLMTTSTFGQEGENDILEDSLKDVYTVIAIGSGGAILGLSTLSFADEPSEELKNILVGASIGVIIGVGVVAWSQAAESRNQFIDNARFERKSNSRFGTYARNSWHQSRQLKLQRQLNTERPFFSGSLTF